MPVRGTVEKDTWRAIGVMSGSSLDGLDIAYCQFTKSEEGWKWEILACETFPYTPLWKKRLEQLAYQDAITYLKASAYYGIYIGEKINEFLSKHQIDRNEVDFVASHGHTVFHKPEAHVSSQVGDGAKIAVTCGLPTISLLRDADVALGGRGAPIVAAADLHLFPQYTYALNLGGFANISVKLNDGSICGFDIVPVNVVINKIARQLGYEMDTDGNLGREGVPDRELLNRLNALDYYAKKPPKCLTLGWVNKTLEPVFQQVKTSRLDRLRTCYEHIAMQIARAIDMCREMNVREGEEKMLVTGGGAFNKFLMEKIQEHLKDKNVEIEVPDERLVKFKEALAMAFLGVLRMEGKPNVYASVTGAERDTICGYVHLPS